MPWLFRRSVTILPGVRINLGKKSASVSLGVRGLRYTTGTAGKRVTVGLPGTGLSYTKRLKDAPQSGGSILSKIIFGVVIVPMGIFIISFLEPVLKLLESGESVVIL